MKKKILFILSTIFLVSTSAQSKIAKRIPAQASAPLVLIGNIPGEYLGSPNKNSVMVGFIEIQNKVIENLGPITEDVNKFKSKISGKIVLELKNSKTGKYDVIYPGLIDLHNHTKQNNLPVWGLAKGQFANRFEWRDWTNYSKSVSDNMNPWIGYGKPIECAAFRWSHLQAMVGGTLYLQGPSSCIDGFGIRQVESAKSYRSKKSAVQAPTDLVIPNDMVVVWNEIRPLMASERHPDGSYNDGAYERALDAALKKYCNLPGITAANIDETDGLKILKDQDLLMKSCGPVAGKPELPPKFIRYVYWVHPTIAGKKKYFKYNRTTGTGDPTASAMIAHLAEGRSDDAYNTREYELVQLFGLNVPHVNFVHGVGITPEGLRDMAQNQMGLIWSPFSNLLLYSQTLDIATAKKAGVMLALGSDWLPTGSRHVLEELKTAREYIRKMKFDKVFSDEDLYRMVTENPAKMINHFENTADESGIGRLAKGSMGSVIAVTLNDPNPYTNLVAYAYEKDINLAVVDGLPIYGETSYLDALKLKGQYETLPLDYDDSTITKMVNDLASVKPATAPDADTTKQLTELAKLANNYKPSSFNRCNISKGFVFQNTVEPELKTFQSTGLNLDRAEDITKILAINIMTQNRNVDSSEGDPNFRVGRDSQNQTFYFPPLYSCNDQRHEARIKYFINTEFPANTNARGALRTSLNLGKGPQNLAESYKK